MRGQTWSTAITAGPASHPLPAHQHLWNRDSSWDDVYLDDCGSGRGVFVCGLRSTFYTLTSEPGGAAALWGAVWDHNLGVRAHLRICFVGDCAHSLPLHHGGWLIVYKGLGKVTVVLLCCDCRCVQHGLNKGGILLQPAREKKKRERDKPKWVWTEM